MDSISAVAVAPTTARKHGSLVGLAPLLGLAAGGGAAWWAISAFQEPRYYFDSYVREVGVTSGVAAVGALLAAWGVVASSAGRRIPTALLMLTACASWLVALPWVLFRVPITLEALAYASPSERLVIAGSGVSDDIVPRFLGALLSAGVLLGVALGMARVAGRQETSERGARGWVRGFLLSLPVLALPVASIASGAEAPLTGVLCLLALAFLAIGTLVGPVLGSSEPRAATLATGALWMGALGVLAGCVGLRATAYTIECLAMGSVDPADAQVLMELSTRALGTMRMGTGVALLTCTLAPVIFALQAARRGAMGARIILGAAGTVLLALMVLGADTLAAGNIEGQLSALTRALTIPEGSEHVRQP